MALGRAGSASTPNVFNAKKATPTRAETGEGPSWLTADGRLDPEKLLDAFLHRVVNGGGTLDREYAIGSGRMDLCLRYGSVTMGIELKVWRDGEADPLAEGLEQLDGYLAGLGLMEGWLVVFDRRSGRPPIGERTTVVAAASPAGRAVKVIRG